jgi:hypothetical protein
MGKSGLQVSSKNKNQSLFMKIVKSPPAVILAVFLLLLGLYFSYKAIHYYSAPAEIKAIRKLPIYNYESENLKIVRRSEDYGGFDWKHVYNKPSVIIRYVNEDSKGLESVTNSLENNGWRSSVESSFDKKEGTERFAKSIEGKIFQLSIRISSDRKNLTVIIRG